MNAPIFVTDAVAAQAKSVQRSADKAETDEWEKWLEHLKPDDFGKYNVM